MFVYHYIVVLTQIFMYIFFKSRDHPFDLPRKKKVVRQIKFGTVSSPSAPSRRALPVVEMNQNFSPQSP